MRVLVVEDEPELTSFLVRTLRETAWAPDSVHDTTVTAQARLDAGPWSSQTPA